MSPSLEAFRTRAEDKVLLASLNMPPPNLVGAEMGVAPRERALFGQPEVGAGTIPGADAAQHLTRLLGRGRALELLLGSDDFAVNLAEKWGWISARCLTKASVRSPRRSPAGSPGARFLAASLARMPRRLRTRFLGRVMRRMCVGVTSEPRVRRLAGPS
jgi:enoyl-CoA hydratase/carnithine racemase